MESKKKIMSSLLEDSSGPALSASGVGSSSPFRPSPLTRTDSYGRSASPDASLSCVTRETSQEECARHRFIVWAAVKRNLSKRMTPQEKLECPLLRCTLRFNEHESMLRHLAVCDHLPSGEYWCYDHMRVERFDDLKCKRCLGHPSKRRKMLSIAKHFFHTLGHRSKKGLGYEALHDEDAIEPPPRYESVSPLDVTELSSATEIVEIDSTEVDPVAAFEQVGAAAIDPQALLVPELDSIALAPDTIIQHAMQWQPTPLITTSAPLNLHDYGETRSPSFRPSLQLNTSGLQGVRSSVRPAPRPRPEPTVVRSTKGLSPSSSVRSTASTDSNVSSASNVSSLISPVSNWSGAWSMASGHNTNLTSPVDLVSPSDLLMENPFTDHVAYDSCPDFLHSFYSELPADSAPQELPDMFSSDPLLLSFDPPATGDLSYAADIILAEESSSLATDLDESDDVEPDSYYSETKALVGSAWDALQEHIVSSILKIQQIRANALADQLRSMSTKTIATAGLSTLRSLLNGQQPSSSIDTLCFIHLIYAFSLVLHEQGTSTRSKDLFLQSLSYSIHLPADSRDMYTQLVYGIWQPADITQADISMYFTIISSSPLSRSSSRKGKQPDIGASSGAANDVLLFAARNFLDELESSILLAQSPLSSEVQESELYTKHLMDFDPSASLAPGNSPFAVTMKFIMTMLDRDFQDAENLGNKLGGVLQRVNNGTICSVRRAEIEVLQAGKDCMATLRYFDDFVPGVRRLCDPVYAEHDQGISRRTAYHSLGISLIESLLPELDSTSLGSPQLVAEDHEDLDLLLESLDTGAFTGSNLTARSMSQITAVPYAGEPSSMCDLDTTLAAVQAFPAVIPEAIESVAGSLTPSPHVSLPLQPPGEAADDLQALSDEEGLQPDASQTEANSCCELCGYRPKGHPQWFKGSMAKHKKLQHSAAPPIIYRCPYPGCNSRYKNRPDNLRQHQLEKKHFVDGEEGTTRRPSKRKKMSTVED